MRRPNGFTLIEIILIIVVAGIMWGALGQYLNTTYQHSTLGYRMLLREQNLQSMMERLTAAYRSRLAAGTLDLAQFKTDVENDSEYGPLVDSANTGFITFSDADGDGVFTASNVQATPFEDSMLMVTLTSGDQSVTGLFTE